MRQGTYTNKVTNQQTENNFENQKRSLLEKYCVAQRIPAKAEDPRLKNRSKKIPLRVNSQNHRREPNQGRCRGAVTEPWSLQLKLPGLLHWTLECRY